MGVVVVVERSFGEPASFEELEAREQAVAWCLEQYRVAPVNSFMSRNRRHMVCVYAAPDAEAVRATQREGGLPFDHIWSGIQIDPPQQERPPGYAEVIVQRALPTKTSEALARQLYEQSADCHRNHRVRLQYSLLSQDGTRLLCRYLAPDAESVRNANIESGLPVESVWPATVHGNDLG